MPIYEYACDKCGHEFEREQRIADPPVKTCPECKGRKVTKLISRSSFVLKGGGWYADGYASADESKKKGSDSDGGETKSDTKSDAKSGDGATTSSKDAAASDSKTKGAKEKSVGSKKKGGGKQSAA